MPLDTLLESGVNIKHLTLNHPKSETATRFDPRDYFSEEDKLEFMDELKKVDIISEPRYRFPPLILALNILYPEEKNHFSELVSWKDIQSELDSSKQETELDRGIDYPKIYRLTTILKTLYPEKDAELGLDEISQRYKNTWWNLMINHLKFERRHRGWEDFSFSASSMKLLNIQRFNDLQIDEYDWRGIMGMLEELKNQGDWFNSARLAAQIRILFPDKDVSLYVDNTNWESMEKYLQTLDPKVISRNKISNYMRMSLGANMAILAAESVKVTEHGLEVKMPQPKSFQEPIPDIPEQRRF